MVEDHQRHTTTVDVIVFRLSSSNIPTHLKLEQQYCMKTCLDNKINYKHYYRISRIILYIKGLI